jgi:hypothetical protein
LNAFPNTFLSVSLEETQHTHLGKFRHCSLVRTVDLFLRLLY